jgi:osmoprotectant transport system permease protein
MRWLSALAVALAVGTAGVASAGPRTRVGSKQFTEGVILGEIVTQVAAGAGADAEHRAQMGGTRILWTALTSGDIDVYPEYSGTLALEILAGTGVPSGDLGALRRALAGRGIGVVGPLGFENTYALAMTEARAAALGVRTISDLARLPALEVGVSNEFLDRGDGWPGLRDRYQLPQKAVRGLQHDLAYRAVADGAIDVTDVYTTDAEIAALELRVLADDRDYFPDYQALLVYRLAWAEQAPAVLAALTRLENAIPPAAMIEMNGRARLDRVPEARVAADRVARLGLAGNGSRAASGESLAAATWSRGRAHLAMVGLALLLAIAIAVPLGVAAARWRNLGQIVLAVVGIVQTVPSLALLVLLIPVLGIGGAPAVAAMFAYSLLPIVRNTHAGLTGTPGPIRESAEALGLSSWTRLTRVDLPLASPAIVAGIQTAAVLSVGTATIGALVGAGGFGQPILTGIRLDDTRLILEGALPAAALALAVQGLFEIVERLLVPRGLRLRGEP